MTTLAEIEQEITDTREAMRRADLARRRVLANLDAVPMLTASPEARIALEAERLDELRAAEGEALALVATVKRRADELDQLLNVTAGVNLSPEQWSTAAAMRGFIADQVAGAGLADLAKMLNDAQFGGSDPAAAYTVARAVETRIRAGQLDALRTGPADVGVTIGQLQNLIADVDRALRKPSANPVRTRAQKLATEADDLELRIRELRSNRGEGPKFGNPNVKVVPFDDRLTVRQEFDIAGRPKAG